MVAADFPGGDWITAARGEAARTAVTNITADNTWTDSQLSVTIAAAGTYLVTAVVPVSINVTALGSSPRIVARLFNVTGGGAVGSSYVPCIEAQVAGTTIVGCATISNIVSVAANTTLRVEILRTAGPTYTASNLFYVAGFYVPRMNYVRLV